MIGELPVPTDIPDPAVRLLIKLDAVSVPPTFKFPVISTLSEKKVGILKET